MGVAGSGVHLHEGVKGKVSGKRGVLQDQGSFTWRYEGKGFR